MSKVAFAISKPIFHFLDTSGRQKTLACQNDNAWSLCDPSCGYFINLWVFLIWHWVQNLKTSLWFKKQRRSCTKSKWLNTKSLTVL
jgi:hypothetical protein